MVHLLLPLRGVDVQIRELLAFPMRLWFLKCVDIQPDEFLNISFILFFHFTFFLTFLNSRNGIVHLFLIKQSITNDMYMKANHAETLLRHQCIASQYIDDVITWQKNLGCLVFLNWFSSNLHTDTLALLFICACCKLLMFRAWFRKHALAFPTHLVPAILKCVKM